MQTCGKQYGVFVDGKWQWFTSYAEAQKVESHALTSAARAKLATGERVILTRSQLCTVTKQEDK